MIILRKSTYSDSQPSGISYIEDVTRNKVDSSLAGIDNLIDSVDKQAGRLPVKIKPVKRKTRIFRTYIRSLRDLTDKDSK